jgi:hypothetical protein
LTNCEEIPDRSEALFVIGFVSTAIVFAGMGLFLIFSNEKENLCKAYYGASKECVTISLEEYTQLKTSSIEIDDLRRSDDSYCSCE